MAENPSAPRSPRNPATPRATPYVGPQSFERDESDIFFGREGESQELLSLLVSERVTLLHAPSGAGKTSLINAGLLPLLEGRFEVLPPARLGRAAVRLPDSVANAYVFALLSNWDADPGTGLHLSDWLSRLKHGEDEHGETLPRAVIIDQAEELFLTYPERWHERRPFLLQIEEALERDPLLRVLLGIRQDFLAELTRHGDVFSDGLRARLQLELLNPDAAQEAIAEPLAGTGRSFKAGVVERLVSDLRLIEGREHEGALAEFVEPVILQVVCRNLWLGLAPDKSVITQGDLRATADALADFYDEAVAATSRTYTTSDGLSFHLTEGRLRAWIESTFITPIGTRNTVFRGDERTADMPNEVLDRLESRRLLRSELRARAQWYELTHDRLIEPIRKSNSSQSFRLAGFSSVNSSRTSREAAGWFCGQPADVAGLYRPGFRARGQFSWVSARPLWEARNARIAQWFGSHLGDERKRWVEAQRRRGIDPRLSITRHAESDEVSFILLAGPGTGDDSQYQVLRPLRAASQNTAFTYVVSDVVYPAGDTFDYIDKFHWPYRGLPGPTYAIPGDRDWLDGLHGFMTQLCGADPDLRPPPVFRENRRLARAFLAAAWREPSPLLRTSYKELAELRPEPSGQPSSYFTIELKELLLVGLDAALQDGIDDEQGEWFRKVTRLPKDKILLTGRPLVVDATRRPCRIAGSSESVNELVEDPANRFIAVVGGGTHNYQRYPVRQADGRVIQHIVAGAAGAYTEATHTIPRATFESCGCDESDFRCYPRRGDSLAAYSILLNRKLPLDLTIPPEVAPAVVSLRLGRALDAEQPRRPEDDNRQVPEAVWKKAMRVFPLSDERILGPLKLSFNEFLDWNDPYPPLFKSFLKIETRPGEVEIRCFGVSGCEEHADDPPLEDWIKGARNRDGQWTWEVLLD